MPGDAPQITKQELFTRLAEGHAAGISVVTPNNRLASALRSEFDFFEVSKNLPAWEDADILPLDTFVERCHENAIYADEAAKHPLLLSAAQEQALWESVVRPSGLLAVAETAAECAKAWRLAHQWRIEGALALAGNDDTRAFAGWAREYARRCEKENWTDAARLPDRKRSLFEKQPKLLVAYGFDVLPPQTAEFFRGFSIEVLFSGPEKRKSNPVKTLYPSARQELEAAAKWARGRIEKGAQRVGLVVPRLGERRREVLRAFARAGVPVDVSLGEPLAGYPLAGFALLLFEFLFNDITFEDASRFIRSPFVGGADAEFAARARLDARLRRRLGYRVSLPKLVAEAKACEVLRFQLEKVFSVERPERATPHEWARYFTSVLEAAGFPGERALDSAEHQARAKLNEVLGEFARLTFVLGKIPAEEAIRKLKGLCAATLFQPERPAAPVHALGILESAGLEFDCLWVSGLTEEAWPLVVRPNPFLPLAAQRRAGIPQASAEASLAFDRRITAGWAAAAAEVVFSCYEKEEDRELLASPLIAEVPAGRPEIPEVVTWRDLIFRSGKTEALVDEKASPLKEKTVSGGTRVLADQAACPFRAFARHRLGARELEAPGPGLDARGRGILLHALMAGLWTELKGSAALSSNVGPAIEKAAAKAIEELQLQGEFALLERRRLEKLAREWLEIERGRKAAFEVAGVEKKIEIKISNLAFQGRIDRLDRLADGSHAVIDYKTGNRATPDDWMGPRPEEPQLPVYALAAPEKVGAVAYARLKTGKMRFSGFSEAKGVMPKVSQAQSWPGLLKGWKKETEKLAAGFAAGEARVDPKHLANTCRKCDLQPLCRVHERLSFLEEAEEEGE